MGINTTAFMPFHDLPTVSLNMADFLYRLFVRMIMEEAIMSDFYDFNIAKRNSTNDLRMPDKKKYYVNKRFDRNAYEWAVIELQENIYSLSKYNPSVETHLANFTKSISKQLILNASGKNKVFSPISIYITLAMLAVLSDGSSQKQILDLLGYDNKNELLDAIDSLIPSLSVSTDFYKSLVSTSLWFNDQVLVNKNIILSLADRFGTDSFSGDIHDPAYTSAMWKWLNNATGKMLKGSSESLDFDPLSVLIVISSILFKALWDDEFNLSKTKSGTFYASNEPAQVSFMYQDDKGTVFFGNTFTAIFKGLSYGNSMIFILPNEGFSPEELISGEDIYKLLSDERIDIRNKDYIIHETIPKFDITQQYEISPILKETGITDIFDEAQACFKNSVKATDNVYISKIAHTCRLKIDERGCEGAAQTIPFAVACCAGPTEEYDFVLDRPFIAVVCASNGSPLFLSVVNNPEEQS